MHIFENCWMFGYWFKPKNKIFTPIFSVSYFYDVFSYSSLTDMAEVWITQISPALRRWQTKMFFVYMSPLLRRIAHWNLTTSTYICMCPKLLCTWYQQSLQLSSFFFWYSLVNSCTLFILIHRNNLELFANLIAFEGKVQKHQIDHCEYPYSLSDHLIFFFSPGDNNHLVSKFICTSYT